MREKTHTGPLIPPFKVEDDPEAPQTVTIDYSHDIQPDPDFHPESPPRDLPQGDIMDWLRGTWDYVGVVAQAKVRVPIGEGRFAIYVLTSPGSWGHKSNRGRRYYQIAYESELLRLKRHLALLSVAVVWQSAPTPEECGEAPVPDMAIEMQPEGA